MTKVYPPELKKFMDKQVSGKSQIGEILWVQL